MKSGFRYPTGTRPLLIAGTARRRAIEGLACEVLEASGYREIVLPILDYHDPYTPLGYTENGTRSYRFVDRDGELVTVRSDFTPMVARALTPLRDRAGTTLRVFYRGEVIRCEPSRLGRRRELFQIGAELVGDDSPQADLEILRIALTAARAFDSQPSISYNDVSIVSALETTWSGSRVALITKRMPAGAPPAIRDVLERLIAGAAKPDDVRPFAPLAASRLEAIGASVDPGCYAMHLDDVDESPCYYTGLRFRLYGSANGERIGEGGRYDSLYGLFGEAAPAAGFTLTLPDCSDERVAAEAVAL